MLKLTEFGNEEWEFVYPASAKDVTGEFHRGCEFLEDGQITEAEKIFKSVLAQMPDHIDAIHHLAIVNLNQGLSAQARELWQQAVRIGRKAFPPDFQPGQDHLPWDLLDNRPFLRALHGLALAKFNSGETEEALQLFQELLALNPFDNQGARVMAVESLFKLGRFEDILKITDKFRWDIMPDTLYGRALALFRLNQRKKATLALKRAVLDFPMVGRELLKKRHKIPQTPGFRMMRGDDEEAYEYWSRFGQFWEEDPEACEWLETVVWVLAVR
jgi:tetratricopeptide (TPR) repeat protein